MNGSDSQQTAILADGERWQVVNGDCMEEMSKMPAACIDMAIFSPPFSCVFAYTNSVADIGNSEDFRGDVKLHLSFFFRQFARILKPGRAALVHVQQIPRRKRDGEVGLHDFRGLNIRLGERAGLVYEYDWLIDKNPQAAAIRTRARELQFTGLETDRVKARGVLADYLIKFRAPGDNATPVLGEGVSRDDWIRWAEANWTDIRQTDTLNVREARSEEDVKHICALQLQLIERAVRLFSAPDEIVFSPFGGIGSELYSAINLGRRAYGIELKSEYYDAAVKNCQRAEALERETQPTLFPELHQGKEGIRSGRNAWLYGDK